MCGYGQVRQGRHGGYIRGRRPSASCEADRVPSFDDERAARGFGPSALGRDVDRSRPEQARRPLAAARRFVEELGEIQPEHPRDLGDLGRAGLVLAAFPRPDLRLALTEGSSERCAVLKDGFPPAPHQVVPEHCGANSCTRFPVRQVWMELENPRCPFPDAPIPKRGICKP